MAPKRKNFKSFSNNRTFILADMKKDVEYCRASDSNTLSQLTSELLVAFPFAEKVSGPFNIEAILKNAKASRSVLSNLYLDIKNEKIYAFLRGTEASPISVVCLSPLSQPNSIDLKFANAYIRIFNQDVANCQDEHKDEELWETLKQTRMARTIARMTNITTLPFLKLLATVEDASHLQYEGGDFLSTILISNNEQRAEEVAGSNFLAFSRKLQLSEALVQAKWIRAIAGHVDVVINCFGRYGTIIGISALKTSKNNAKGSLILPGELQPIANLVDEGTIALARAKNGDLYVIIASGASFVKSHGKWYYLNYETLQLIINKFMVDVESTKALLELILDASHNRMGALYCIPESENDVASIVADYKIEGGPNYVLRETSDGLDIKQHMHRKFVSAAASVDGATIISKTGIVIDVACMVAQPDKSRLLSLSISELERYPGARSTAAINASLFGTSIKISADGPITIFKNGKILGQLGN